MSPKTTPRDPKTRGQNFCPCANRLVLLGCAADCHEYWPPKTGHRHLAMIWIVKSTSATCKWPLFYITFLYRARPDIAFFRSRPYALEIRIGNCRERGGAFKRDYPARLCYLVEARKPSGLVLNVCAILELRLLLILKCSTEQETRRGKSEYHGRANEGRPNVSACPTCLQFDLPSPRAEPARHPTRARASPDWIQQIHVRRCWYRHHPYPRTSEARI